MALKIYTYKNCDSCRKAVRWLKENSIPFEEHPIRETPPKPDEFKKALQSGIELKALFNRSGQDYRAQNLKEKLPSLSEEEAISLLTQNGNLVKRPFALSGNSALVGFKPDLWDDQLR